MSAATTGAGGPVWVDPRSGELTVQELADRAADAVRGLNHLTRPGVDALTDPAQADRLVAALAETTGRLPQLLAQLTSWLTTAQRTGRVRLDTCWQHTDPADTVAAVTDRLTQAARSAHATGRALDAAHQDLARLATAGHEPEWP